MTLYKELSYDGEDCVSKIKGIQFCILGPDEIRRRSVAEINKTDTYAINEPVMNGLFDARMGVIDNNKICKTCEQRNTFCTGHFGHIEMERPLFYVQFFGIVQKLLRCVCFRCSKILVDLQDPIVHAVLTKKHSRQKRWEYMHKLCSNVKRCGKETIDGCGARQPDRIAKTDAMKICMEWKDLVDGGTDEVQESAMRRQVYGADDVLRILKRITDEDADALGLCPKYNRPEWMICTVLPVPPPCVRPSVRNDTGVRKEDDLTHKLSDIIKYNNIVKSKIEKGASYDNVEWYVAALQQHVATLIDNTGSFVSKDRTGRIFRTICDRLNRKEGRIRGNLMGKRVDFSARTVITPDPNISIDELGVPLKIAMNLTFPEVVNAYNIDHMYRLVRNGPEVYPGAKHLRKGHRTIRLKGNDRDSITLDFGDIVDRHLINGDYVLFNRQPSLHKMSMMAHRVRVMPHHTFRLNVCVCASYNADFDGDEMNMHVPQSLQSHEEIVQLAAVPLHIISPRHSKPIISIVQDVALGVFRITQGHVSVTKKQLFNLICSNPIFVGTVPKPGVTGGNHERWTGRQLMSTIIPPTTMLSMYPDIKSDDPKFVSDDHHVRVKCGELLTGVLTTKAFNDPARGFVRNIVNDGGPEAVTLFLNNTQKLICDWLVLSGFSVGISDLLAPVYKRERIKQQVTAMHAAADAKIALLHAGEMKNVSTLNNRQFFESQIDSVSKSCMFDIEKVALNDIDVRNNRMLNMIKSGSKGQSVNFLQMLACLGQQAIDGQRIPDGFDHRTLPHFTKYDDGPSSRGFVEHSFVEGLSPQEFFFHSMAGRVGLIDTAVRSVTWDTAIVILEAGVTKYVRIGDWIDAHLDDNQGKVETFPDDRNLEVLSVPDVFIPTVDEVGNVTWGQLTAVTRHDPGHRLYKVVTHGGREVVVAESQSLLVWDAEEKKLLPKASPNVRVGDLLPVTMNLADPPTVVTKVAISSYLLEGEDATFDLNVENGIFIGLYLAGGEDSTANSDFVKAWFDSSTLPMRFLDKFVGESSKARFVPDVAFAAPEEFVKGLLAGYFPLVFPRDGDIAACCVSKRLNEGIAMLCSRLGAFAKISTLADGAIYRVSVRKEWATILSHKIDFNIGKASDGSSAAQNDVVLDKILYIESIPVDDHKKLYDVTVPETLNFILANGLGVRDTSETGYIQRKLVTFMQDLKVHTDLTVRNSAGQIVQFLYGEDGIDATKVEYQFLPYVESEVHAMRADHLIMNLSELRGHVTDEVLMRPLDTPRMSNYFESLVSDREFAIEVQKGQMDSQIMHPVNLSIMILKASELMEAHGAVGRSDLHPDDVLDIIEGLRRDLTCSVIGGTKFMGMLLRCHLSPKQLIVKRRFTRAVLDVVVKQIRTRFFDSIAHPGEMVGILAAQSIGEPTTQTTLNTFHLAGVGAASITTQQGVPRLQELFHASKNIKTPYMKIFVQDPWSTDMSRCRDVCSAVQTTRFRDVVRQSKVYYDPPGQEISNIEADRDLLKAFDAYTSIMDPQCPHESAWVLRLEFDRTKMLELQVCMVDLETILREFYDDTVACVFSDDNAANLVARVRLNNKDIDLNDMLTELRALEDNILQTVVIKGVKNIEKAVPLKPNEQLMYDKMTSTFVKRSEWAIETSGTNLIEVLSLPRVDPVRTYTNDINEINHVLGIEAARQALYNELQAVMWQKDTNSVNYRHMALLVDAMTSRGFLTSVNRHGINKGDIGPLAKCSFEQTTEMLIQAGVFSELDRINGVAANIILGQVAPCGTGDSEILIDEAALQVQGHEVPLPELIKTYGDVGNVTTKVSLPQLPQLPNYKPGDASVNNVVDGDELQIM